jgi:hypothetical protein
LGPPQNYTQYSLGFVCNGTFSSFTVTTNKAPSSGSGYATAFAYPAAGGAASERGLNCQTGPTSYSCSVPAPPFSVSSVRISSGFHSNETCPGYTASVSVNGMTVATSTSCPFG